MMPQEPLPATGRKVPELHSVIARGIVVGLGQLRASLRAIKHSMEVDTERGNNRALVAYVRNTLTMFSVLRDETHLLREMEASLQGDQSNHAIFEDLLQLQTSGNRLLLGLTSSRPEEDGFAKSINSVGGILNAIDDIEKLTRQQDNNYDR